MHLIWAVTTTKSHIQVIGYKYNREGKLKINKLFVSVIPVDMHTTFITTTLDIHEQDLFSVISVTKSVLNTFGHAEILITAFLQYFLVYLLRLPQHY